MKVDLHVCIYMKIDLYVCNLHENYIVCLYLPEN